jgi:hypothetical protein
MLGRVAPLGLQLRESPRQLQARMSQRQDVNLAGNGVADQYLLPNRMDAQAESIVRAFLEQRRELGNAPKGAV